jgi:hypothetical protein
MSTTRHTPPLSAASSKEVAAELKRAPADTPERRATFARAASVANLARLALAQVRVKRV